MGQGCSRKANGPRIANGPRMPKKKEIGQRGPQAM